MSHELSTHAGHIKNQFLFKLFSIGAEYTGVIAKVYMRWWDRQYIISAMEVGIVIQMIRRFVDDSKAQIALLGIQFMWTADTQTALEECKRKKSGMKECNARQNNLLLELSSWCLQDLGTKVNRKKIETLVTIHVHQKDVTTEMSDLGVPSCGGAFTSFKRLVSISLP